MRPLFNFLCLFALFLPFQFALNLKYGFDISVLRIIILLLFGTIALKSLYKRDFFIPLNLQSVCLVLFFSINIFSLFFAQNLEFGLRKILFIGSIFPLYFIVFYAFKQTTNSPLRRSFSEASKLQTTNFAKYFILGGFLSAMTALIIFFNQFIFGINGILKFYEKIGPFFWGRSFSESVLNFQSFLVNIGGRDFIRAAGLFPDPHNFSLFSGIISLLAFAISIFYLKAKNKLLVIFYGAIFAISAFSMIFSFSRGAYLALVVTVLFIMVYLILFKKIFFLRLSVLLFLAGILLFFVVAPAKSRFLDAFSFKDESSIGRIQIMKDGIDIFKNNFLFGVGIGNAPLHYNEDIEYRNPTNSHNTYLEIAIESGFFGLALWAILIFGSVLQLIKSLKIQKDEFLRYLTVGLASALIFFGAYSFFEVFLYSPVNLAALMILLGLSSIVISNIKNQNAK